MSTNGLQMLIKAASFIDKEGLETPDKQKEKEKVINLKPCFVTDVVPFFGQVGRQQIMVAQVIGKKKEHKHRPWSKLEAETCVYFMREFGNNIEMTANAMPNRSYDEVKAFFS